MYSLKLGNSFILLLFNAHLCKNIICIVKNLYLAWQSRLLRPTPVKLCVCVLRAASSAKALALLAPNHIQFEGYWQRPC